MEEHMKKLTVLLAFTLLTTISYAQSDIDLKGVGARIGFIMPEDPIDETIGFGLNAHLGTLMPNLTLHGYLDYWSKGYDSSSEFHSSESSLLFMKDRY